LQKKRQKKDKIQNTKDALQYVFLDVLGKNLSSAKVKDFCKSSIGILSEATSDSQLQ
jgi:hypothetical protein